MPDRAKQTDHDGRWIEVIPLCIEETSWRQIQLPLVMSAANRACPLADAGSAEPVLFTVPIDPLSG